MPSWAGAIDGTISGFRKATMQSNRALGEIKSVGSAVKNTGAASRARGIGRSLASDMKTGKGIAKMAGTAAVGGAAGYATSDRGDRTAGTIKGFGLGAIAGAGWVAGGNSRVQSTLREGYGGAKRIGGEVGSDIQRAGRPKRVLGGEGMHIPSPSDIMPSASSTSKAGGFAPYSVGMNQMDVKRSIAAMPGTMHGPTSGMQGFSMPSLKTSPGFRAPSNTYRSS